MISAHSGNSIQMGIFVGLPARSMTQTAPSPRFGLQRCAGFYHEAGERGRRPEHLYYRRSGYCGRGCHHPDLHCGSRWGHFTGRHAVDFLPAELRPSRSCVEASVPSTVPQLSGAGLRCRRVAVLFLPGATSDATRFLAPHRSHQENKLEGLRQAPFADRSTSSSTSHGTPIGLLSRTTGCSG